MFDLKNILSIDLVGDICDRREIWMVVRLPCQGIVYGEVKHPFYFEKLVGVRDNCILSCLHRSRLETV